MAMPTLNIAVSPVATRGLATPAVKPLKRYSLRELIDEGQSLWEASVKMIEGFMRTGGLDDAARKKIAPYRERTNEITNEINSRIRQDKQNVKGRQREKVDPFTQIGPSERENKKFRLPPHLTRSEYERGRKTFRSSLGSIKNWSINTLQRVLSDARGRLAEIDSLGDIAGKAAEVMELLTTTWQIWDELNRRRP